MKINVRKQADDVEAENVDIVDVLDGQIPRRGDVLQLKAEWWTVEYVEYAAYSRNRIAYLEPTVIWVRPR